MYVFLQSLVYTKFWIQWCIVCLLHGKKVFPYGSPIKNAPLWIFVSNNLPRGDQLGVSLNLYLAWVGEDLHQIWCFLKNRHYGFAYTSHYL